MKYNNELRIQEKLGCHSLVIWKPIETGFVSKHYLNYHLNYGEGTS